VSAGRVLALALSLALAVALFGIQRRGQQLLLEEVQRLNLVALWVLVIVVPAIPVTYVLVVWWRARSEAGGKSAGKTVRR
jgi:Na+/H+-dicarboxylate symporter